MGKRSAIPEAVAKRLVELSVSQPAVHSFNRQFVRIVVDTTGADAVTLWLVRENELILCEQIEERVGAVQQIQSAEDRQQAALREAFEEGEVQVLESGSQGFDPFQPGGGAKENLVFVPVAGLQGNVGVMRLVFRDVSEEVFPRLIQLAELLSGYYSLYTAQRILNAQHKERQDIDKLSKTIVQLQHYSLSSQLPEVVVNSAMEIANLDRAVLLTPTSGTELEVKAVSSVANPDRKGAWSRLACDLGRLVLRRGEPVHFFPGVTDLEQIEDEELRDRLNSYVPMTDVTALLVYPLQSAGHDVGVLILENFEDQQLGAFERVLCTVYATHAGSALANHQLFTSLPLSSLLAKKVDKETAQIKRGPGKLSKLLKVAVVLGVLGAIVWLVGFYPVPERIDARCFVQPSKTRLVTAPRAGEIDKVNFEQGAYVQQDDLLLRLRTDEVQTRLNEELENLEALNVQLKKLRGEAEETENTAERSSKLARASILRHSLEAKKHEVERLRYHLEQCFLRAPMTGMVIEPEHPDELQGVVVKEGEPLCRIGSVTKDVKIRVAVPAERVDDVETGQKVEIHLRPLITEKTITGRIEKMAERSVTYENSNVFMADVFVDNIIREDPEKGQSRYVLKPGMTGKADVVRPGESTYFAIYGGMLYRKIKYWLY